MHIMSTNFAKKLVWKDEYDVKLWRHKERTANANDNHMPLIETPPWKSSAYATTLCCAIYQPLTAKRLQLFEIDISASLQAVKTLRS